MYGRSIPIAVTLAFLALAPLAEAKPKPDFTVKSAKIRSISLVGALPYIIEDRIDDGLLMEVKVKNQGDVAAAGAGKVTVLGVGLLGQARIVFDVPRLKAGRSKTIEVDIKQSDLGGITRYTTKACASTPKDPNHRNDCKRGPGFAVLPRTWVGSTNATLFNGFVTQSVVASNVTFTFNEVAASTGGYAWLPTGSLTATITGDTDPGCDYSGSGDLQIDPMKASLVMTADLLSYRIASLDSGTYPATAACPMVGTLPYDQEVGHWVDSEVVVARDAEDEFLKGSHPSAFGDVWTWDLRAE